MMSRGRLRDSRSSGERGGILVLVAALIIPLILALVLTIDVNAGRVAREQANKVAQFAALEALNQYVKAVETCESDPTPATCRMRAATRGFNSAAGRTTIVSKQGVTPVALSEANYRSDIGRLIFGKWEYDNSDANVFPCRDHVPTLSSPCFVELTSPTTQMANAIRFQGKFYDTLGSLGFARKILNYNGYSAEVAATAAVMPRIVCVLIDASRSVTSTTHPDGTDQSAVFGLGADNSRAATQEEPKFAALPATRPGGAFDSTIHARDEYRRRYVLGAEDYASMPDAERNLHPDPTLYGGIFNTTSAWGTARGHNNRIDMLNDTGNGYLGPEPLTSIMAGVHQMFTDFKNRQVSGDKGCLAVFDRSLSWSRVIKPTSDFAAIVKRTNFTNTYTRANLAITDTLNPSFIGDDAIASKPSPIYNQSFFDANPREYAARFGYLPDYDYTSDTAAYTDTARAYDAIIKLMEESYNETQTRTQNLVVVVTDGIPNCVGMERGAASALQCNNRFANFFANMNTGGIWNAPYDQYWQQMNGSPAGYVVPYSERTALKTRIKDQAKKNVTTHFVLFGDSTGLNTKDVVVPGSTPARCYTDEEYRSIQPFNPRNWIDSGPEMPTDSGTRPNILDGAAMDTAFDGMSSSNPFKMVNRFAYELSVMGRGVYAPIRPPDTGCSGGNRVACVNGTVRTRDPYCRTQRAQVSDAMKKVMEQNPYYIAQIK